MGQFAVDLDFLPFRKALMGAAKNQFPFAISKALNATAKGAQGVIQRELPHIFTLRRNWVVKGIQIRAATKRDLTARVGSVDAFMAIHATGGTKHGKSASVPGPGVRPTFPTLVRRSKFPSRLAAKGGRRRPFFTTLKSGRKVLARRKGKRGLPIEVLWSFPSKVQVNATFAFDDLVEGHVRTNWPKNMTRALDEALRTAVKIKVLSRW